MIRAYSYLSGRNIVTLYWDAVRTEKTLSTGKWAEGKAEGLAEGEAIGMEKGREEGHLEAMRNVARQLKSKGMLPEEIASITGLNIEETRLL